MKQILLIGASGFVGQALHRRFFADLSGTYRVTGTYYMTRQSEDLEKLDITSPEELEEIIVRLRPDYIVFAAGNKNVKDCEADYSRAVMMNSRPVESLTDIISRHGLSSRVLFFSTDYVFDGKRGQYRDDETPRPLTNYGKTKVLAEQALLTSGIDFKILRISAVMGRGGVFFDWLTATLKEETQVAMFDNVFFTPTSLAFLSEMVTGIIRNYDEIPGKIIHIAGEQKFSRYQFAILLQSILCTSAEITPESAPDDDTLFQKDLSLVSSDIINRWRKRSFENYLKDEILECCDL